MSPGVSTFRAVSERPLGPIAANSSLCCLLRVGQCHEPEAAQKYRRQPGPASPGMIVFDQRGCRDA